MLKQQESVGISSWKETTVSPIFFFFNLPSIQLSSFIFSIYHVSTLILVQIPLQAHSHQHTHPIKCLSRAVLIPPHWVSSLNNPKMIPPWRNDISGHQQLSGYASQQTASGSTSTHQCTHSPCNQAKIGKCTQPTKGSPLGVPGSGDEGFYYTSRPLRTSST